MEIKVRGPRRPGESAPLWEAEAEVIEWKKTHGHPADHRNIRSLFLESFRRDEGGEVLPQTLLPGTMLAMCRVEKVKVRLGAESHRWEKKDEVYYTVLLLQTRPADWLDEKKEDDFQLPDEFTCTGGEILLDRLAPASQDWKNFFRDVLRDPDHLSVHSGGLSLEGSVKLAWVENEIRALFLVTRPFTAEPPPAVAAELHMTLDRERMSAELRQEGPNFTRWQRSLEEFGAAFGRLSDLLRNESSVTPQPGATPRHRWLALDLTNRGGVPQFRWELSSPQAGARPPLRLARGEAQLLLSDQPPGEQDVPPRSLMNASPELLIKAEGGNSFTLAFEDGERSGGRGRFTLKGTPAAPGGALAEGVTLSGGVTAYDPLTTATHLRRQHQLPDPDETSDEISPAVLWGFVPMEDGWAQLPFLNLTSQIYFNALRTTADLGGQADAAQPLLFGAATFGNDAPEVYKHTDGEQPWSVTLLNGAGFSGFWRFDLLGSGAGARWQLNETLLEVYDPDVALNGFLWLGTQTPTTEDSLPSLDNWLEGARMIPLRTPRPGERFPSPFVLRFDEITFRNEFREEPSGRKFSRPLLSSWKYTYDSNEEPIKKEDGETKPEGEPDYSTLETLLLYGFWGLRPPAGGNWPALGNEERQHFERRRSEFWHHLPLVWRRHPKLPAVQALPLTQNKVPPNYPSPSRQLAPFELPVKDAHALDPAAPGSILAVPDRWQFGVGVTPGAAAWPRLDPSAPARPAAAWARAKYLWLASLGIPGLVHDPTAAPGLLPDPDRFLPAQYLYTLPYTDEPNALAQLPKDEKPNQAGAPVAEVPEERPLLPLAREDYEGHWEGLGEKALLARPDADGALSKSGTQAVVKGLVEPFEWPITASLGTSAYPGTIEFKEDGGAIKLTSREALRGLHAGFSLAGNRLRLDNSPAATFNVTAGSMAAQGSDGRLRDQRGLSRGATQPPTPSGLLKTPLRHEGGQAAHEFTLLTLMRPLSLSPGKGADWQFWFRDVPVADANGTFDRRAEPFLSEFARDVNDPAATSSEFAHLRGYEWRLAESGGPQTGGRAPLPLFGFDFYPLTLEKLITAGDLVRSVELVGRLQLPSGGGDGDAERPELGNAVSVRFDADSGGRLRLSRISSGVNAHGPDEIFGEWPLAAANDGFAPSLRLHSLEYGAETGFKIKLRVSLDFYYFNTRWEITKNTAGAYKEVSLDPGQTGLTVAYDSSFLKEMGDEQVSFSRVTLELKNLKPESLKVFLSFRWGRAGDAPQTQAQATALQARADVTVRLIPAPVESDVPDIKAQLTHTGGADSFELKLSDNKSLVAGALQLEFTDLPAAAAKVLHLLPGMQLSRRERVKGFAVMAFEMSGGSGETRSRLRFTYGGLELIIPCEWGEQLQPDGPRDPQAKPPFVAAKERVFGSSAGRLYAGYTLNGTSGGRTADGPQNVAWQSSLLLNGAVELKNLISWPAPAAELPADLLPVRFPLGKEEAKDIIPQDKATLGKVAQLLIAKPELRLSVEGHADSEGGESHNLDLSRDRAKNVREAIVAEVVSILKPKPADKKKVEESFGSRLAAVGFGQILPRDSNASEQGRLNNRRVEFHPLLFQIPAANPATNKPPLTHTRHTLRVLLNQHEIPQDVLDKGAPTLLFSFNGDAAWQFLAVVEHQLVDVVAARPMGDTVELRNDRRWTAVQEVRFASPSKFALFLEAFRTGAIKTLKLEKNLDKPVALNASQTSAGYHHTRFLELLFRERGGSNEIDKLKETLVVEASSTYWLLPHARPGGSFTNLQYLPLATQRGILSVPGDFAMPEVAPPPPGQPPPPQTPWVLITLPFLGRLQAAEKDLPAGPLNEQTSYLQVDPIYLIEKSRAAGGALPEVARALSSWGDAEARGFRMSHFDTARFRRLKRLDPATSEESWFRLQHPPAEEAAPRRPAAGPGGRKLPSVMAALPTDSPGRLSRPSMLGRLFDEFRNALPPEASDGRVADLSSRADLVWRRNNLFLAQGLSDLDDGLRFYGFFYAGVQIHSSRIPGRDGEPARFAAATLLPANLSVPGAGDEPEEENPVPVSFVVSPYLGVEQRPHTPGAGADLLLAFAELFCLDPSGGSLDFVASQVWQGGQLPPEGGEEVIKLWGREVSSRVASDSPVAVLRVRRVRELELRDIIIEYEFFTLGQGPGRFALPKETRPIRHSVERLRFAEGQFGGSRLPPAGLRAFELAPPQTRGVQPLYLNPELPDFPRDARFEAWTWGLSALRFSVQLTEGKVGVAGEPAGGANTCAWWSVTSHQVQFVVPSKPDSLLPEKFRARSIHSLLPAVPNLPLPDLPRPEPPNEPGSHVAPLAKLQPVLPGAFNYLLVGARAGANFLFRHFILRQELDGPAGGPSSVASGAMSVQHRTPRPVSLPPNRHGQHARALQTWGSVFDLLTNAEPDGRPKTLRLTPNPADNALLLFKEEAAPPDLARGLDVELTDPEGGLLPQQETSKFVFRVSVLSDRDELVKWALNLELVTGGRSLSFERDQPAGGTDPALRAFLPRGATDEKSGAKILREFLAGLAHGAAVHLRMTAQRDEGLAVTNYRQTLNFPLRVALADRQRPPLRPAYVQFEDPEYNRRLSSLTAQVSRVLALGPDRTVELTLASDRREYNPNSSLLLVLARDRADVNLQGLRVFLKRVDTAGVGLNVKNFEMNFQGSGKAVFHMEDLAALSNPPLAPGETLLLALTRPRDGAPPEASPELGFEVLLELRVDIVNRPVTPTPEAGYALLRRRTGGHEAFVECVRFAWSPQPQRIDLVNPDDLLSGLVRRRAVFQWLDVERFRASHEHAVQKVEPSGATHFPLESDSRGPT